MAERVVLATSLLSVCCCACVWRVNIPSISNAEVWTSCGCTLAPLVARVRQHHGYPSREHARPLALAVPLPVLFILSLPQWLGSEKSCIPSRVLRYPIATPILTQLLLINNDFIEASSVEYRIPMTLRNERADELAAQGAQGLRRRDNAIYVPLDGQSLPADTVPD